MAITSALALEFNVDLLAVEDVADEEIEGDEIEGVSEGSPLERRNDGVDGVVDHLRDAEVAQKNGEELAGNVESEGVDAKHVEESGPIGFLLNIDDIHQEGLEQGGETTGNHNIAGAPDALVEGQAVREKIASDDEDGTHDEEGNDLIGNGIFLTDELATVEAEEDVGDGGDGAQQTLRIDGTLVIEMIVAEKVEIDLRQDIDASILGIAIAQDENGGIYYKEADDDRDGITMVAEKGEERHNAVAEGDALHDSPDAEMAKAEEIAFDGVVEPVDEKADGKQQHRSLDDTTDDLGRGFELRLHQREVTRDTHDEEEEGEDEVAGGHAVPLNMLEHLEGFTPAVVNQYHSGNGNAAENVET